jgi:molybdenum cofactor synthesis domain-containing protein
MAQNTCELITTGNELLIGKTVNTNAHWLAKRTTNLGVKISRITVVGDSINEISSVLKGAVKRKNHFIITVGGLGPTFDDITLQGIAKGLGLELKLDEQAKRMIEEKYKEYLEEGRMESVELTPYRLKMAMLPKGAKPLFNPIGTAPGIIIQKNETTIIALPGVPTEMRAMFDDSVLPFIKKEAVRATFFETCIDVIGLMESETALIVDKVMQDNPYVYIKSHPKFEEKAAHLELHLSTTAEESSKARNRVSKALIQLTEMIQKKGGKPNLRLSPKQTI